ncbi:hypothetical protein [Planktotalea sp.]|uniref:hypothetical protein n=1 Tax=Planktotalea sp. TaxID=2029877 RepID=UPI0025F6EB23|nr:hypothetical protein [Planktotalea sp.]
MDVLTTIWELVAEHGDQYVALAFSLFGALVFYLFRLKPKLVFGRAHSSLHNLNIANKSDEEPDNFLEIYSEQFFILNEDRKAATDISLVLSHFPRNIAINPAQKVFYETIENGQCLVTIPYVGARELVSLDCVYLNQRAAFIVSVRCEEAIGKLVDFFTVRQYPNWAYWLLWMLIIFGGAFIIQLLLDLSKGFV